MQICMYKYIYMQIYMYKYIYIFSFFISFYFFFFFLGKWLAQRYTKICLKYAVRTKDVSPIPQILL